MTYTAILTAALWLLLAFGVEHLGRAKGIPSVLLLIVLGQISHPVLGQFGINVSGLDAAVPVIGTIGLVLIVLEGAFDIELRQDRMGLVLRALSSAGLGLVAVMAVFAALAVAGLRLGWVQALVLAVPFAVISSAVAIPSSAALPPQAREFVLYESSLSDILGILVFFTLLQSDGSWGGVVWGLLGSGGLSLLLGSVCAWGLLWVLLRTDGHIRFIPLLAGLFALYAIGKLAHLSPLLMVLLFGLAVNNLDLLQGLPLLRGSANERYEHTLVAFKSLTTELTFAVRGFFFILLGYWTDWAALLDPRAWGVAAVVVLVIFGLRRGLLQALRVPLASSLVWMAPRGLITVLLFLTARQQLTLPVYLDGTVLIVVFVTAAAVLLAKPKPPVRS